MYQKSAAFKAAQSKWALAAAETAGQASGPTGEVNAPSVSSGVLAPVASFVNMKEQVAVQTQTEHHSTDVPPNNGAIEDSPSMLGVLERIAMALECIADKFATASDLAGTSSAVNNLGTSQVSAPFPDPTPSTSSYNANHGVIEMSDDSDDEIDAAKRCGVCKGPCAQVFGFDCGHFPFCADCKNKLEAKEPSSSFLFKCPCTKLVLSVLELKIFDQ